MSGFDGTRTVTYTGPTTDEAQRAFEADRERARGVGYVTARTWWDTSAAQPTLVADYHYAPGDAGAPPMPGAAAARRPPLATRPSAFREAVLISGVVLAGIVLLAAIIPTAPPPPPPAAPAPTAAPAPSSTVPASSPAPAGSSVV